MNSPVNNVFSLNPDPVAGIPGLPRVIRFVPAASMPVGGKLVSLLDHDQNLLVINKDLYGGLSSLNQNRVLRTQASSIELYDGTIEELSFDPIPMPAAAE